MDQAGLSALSERLLPWFGARLRPLPWRIRPTPYGVWVSEIMLQQTRIEAVIPYYERFMQALPTVQALAAADQQTLYKLWEGLGYYSRVRNLQKAAQQLVEQNGGQLPSQYEQLLKLPGIGPYTAGAIASIAFGQAVPAVDGNVLRVLARLLGYPHSVTAPQGKKYLTQLAWQAVPSNNAGAFNQAVMELGQTVCLPGAAVRCTACPLADLCTARAQGTAAELPVRDAPKARKIEQKTVLVIGTQGTPSRFLLHKRADSGLLAGLWELPQLQGHLSPEQAAEHLRQHGLRVLRCAPLPSGKHLFTHIEWQMQGVYLQVEPFVPQLPFVLVTSEQLEQAYALPSALRLYQRMIPLLEEESI